MNTKKNWLEQKRRVIILEMSTWTLNSRKGINCSILIIMQSLIGAEWLNYNNEQLTDIDWSANAIAN